MQSKNIETISIQKGNLIYILHNRSKTLVLVEVELGLNVLNASNMTPTQNNIVTLHSENVSINARKIRVEIRMFAAY